MHGKHVTIVDVGRVVRIQNLIQYEANTGFSNAEKPVFKPNRKTGSSVFFHTGTQPYSGRIFISLHGKMKSAMYFGSLCVCVSVCLCVCVSVCMCIINNVSEFVRSLASRVLEIS